jgi:hypothetical protein
VYFVEIITIIWRNVGRDNPCRGSHPRRRQEAKVIFQDKKIGRKTRMDCDSRIGTNTCALNIVVRVVIILRRVGHYIYNFIQGRTKKM